MLNVSWQHLSTTQRALVNIIYTAAQTGGTVTDLQYNNFTKLTSWRYPYFTVWLNGASEWSAEAQTYFNAMATQPSDLFKGAVNKFISTLVASGDWAFIDKAFMFANVDAGSMLIDMKNPASTRALTVGTTTFTQYTGFTGNGTTGYVNSQFSPNAGGNNFVLNSNFSGVYCRSQQAGNTGYLFGVIGGTGNPRLYLQPRDASNNLNGANLNTLVNSPANAFTSGWFVNKRTGASAINYSRNGVTISSPSSASANIATLPVFIGAHNNNSTAQQFSTYQISFAVFGSASINNTTFYTAVQLMMTELGIQV